MESIVAVRKNLNAAKIASDRRPQETVAEEDITTSKRSDSFQPRIENINRSRRTLHPVTHLGVGAWPRRSPNWRAAARGQSFSSVPGEDAILADKGEEVVFGAKLQDFVDASSRNSCDHSTRWPHSLDASKPS